MIKSEMLTITPSWSLSSSNMVSTQSSSSVASTRPRTSPRMPSSLIGPNDRLLTASQRQEVRPHDDDISGRPSQSLHQEDHEPTVKVGAKVKDLKTRRGCHKQRVRRASGAVAIRCKQSSYPGWRPLRKLTAFRSTSSTNKIHQNVRSP